MKTERQAVISEELCKRIADFLEQNDISSPYTTVYDKGRNAAGELPKAIDFIDMAQFGELPEFWTCDVADELGKRSSARHWADVSATVEAIETTETIREFLRIECANRARGFRKPELRNLCDLAKLAMRSNMGNKKPIYVAESGCDARLHLSRAVCYAYSQESYADHSRYAVPVTIAEGANVEVCKRNLSRFVEALRTHNGYAGSGCTWTAELHTLPAGAFVVFDCRASISD